MAPTSLSSLEIRMKVLSPNYYNFKKFSVLTQTISFLFNCAYLKIVFLTILTAVWKTKSVSYTMVYTPCFEEIYSNIRNQSGCFCELSFLKGGTCFDKSVLETSVMSCLHVYANILFGAGATSFSRPRKFDLSLKIHINCYNRDISLKISRIMYISVGNNSDAFVFLRFQYN